MLLGIVVGVIYVVSLIVAFMVGYGIADQKHTQTLDEE